LAAFQSALAGDTEKQQPVCLIPCCGMTHHAGGLNPKPCTHASKSRFAAAACIMHMQLCFSKEKYRQDCFCSGSLVEQGILGSPVVILHTLQHSWSTSQHLRIENLRSRRGTVHLRSFTHHTKQRLLPIVLPDAKTIIMYCLVLLHTTYTCASKPGCLMTHNWLHTPDCKV
jgi:hypothetical protein